MHEHVREVPREKDEHEEPERLCADRPEPWYVWCQTLPDRKYDWYGCAYDQRGDTQVSSWHHTMSWRYGMVWLV